MWDTCQINLFQNMKNRVKPSTAINYLTFSTSTTHATHSFTLHETEEIMFGSNH